MHISINLGINALYGVNLWWRTRSTEITAPLSLSVIAVALLRVSGWLGGKMVHVHGVAVVIAPEPVPARTPSASPERRLAERRASA